MQTKWICKHLNKQLKMVFSGIMAILIAVTVTGTPAMAAPVYVKQVYGAPDGEVQMEETRMYDFQDDDAWADVTEPKENLVILNKVTFEDLNRDEVFIKQSGPGKCTLASATMIIRRAAILCVDPDWESITEDAVAGAAWRSGVGIGFVFTYGDITMTHDYVNGTSDLKALLKEHPEGIVAYDTYTPHAIALTDYDEETDTFYCCDPADCCPEGRAKASTAMISLENVSAVWYVSAPTGFTLADDPAMEAGIVPIEEQSITTFDQVTLQ